MSARDRANNIAKLSIPKARVEQVQLIPKPPAPLKKQSKNVKY